MDMKPKGHFNYNLRIDSRIVFVFDKRVYVFVFSSGPGNEGTSGKHDVLGLQC
jgi:hypothetical protein